MKLWDWLKGLLAPPHFERIVVLDEVVQDICALARSADPKEMVAFLTGEVKDHVMTVDGLYVKAYDADEYSTSFTTHDLPLTGVLGTVHSHPSGSNRPSSADRALFSKHGWFHLIICRPYTKRTIQAYGKSGERIVVEL